MHPIIGYLIAAALFGIGFYGVLVRRNILLILMAVELMLGAINLILVTTDASVKATTGQVFVLFLTVIAAAEIGVGLAIVLRLFREQSTISIDTVDVTTGTMPDLDAEPPRSDT
ncbi:MAG: NADH-quinone oxidoreductase subunit NuoK [Corynebacteriales bacterium]|nr:NADH-quinone oxidoreductase subunit NuoK [Mycobacteriales bacterium]